MENLARILVEECARSKAWIMLATGASDQAVENWLNGMKPARYYGNVLARLVKRERARKEKK